jgi:hypothetical protein
MRERIERKASEADPIPDPGWDKMEQAGEQARQQFEQSGALNDTSPTPHEDVPQGERLQRPVGTESESY